MDANVELDDELLGEFINEAREHLTTIETDLLAIEEGGANIDAELRLHRATEKIRRLPSLQTGRLFSIATCLRRMMGDEDFARDVASRFLDELPCLLSKLKEDGFRQDLDAVWKQAHKIKGSAANVGGEALRDAALEAERNGKEGDLTGAINWIIQVENQAVQLTSALQVFCG